MASSPLLTVVAGVRQFRRLGQLLPNLICFRPRRGRRIGRSIDKDDPNDNGKENVFHSVGFLAEKVFATIDSRRRGGM